MSGGVEVGGARGGGTDFFFFMNGAPHLSLAHAAASVCVCRCACVRARAGCSAAGLKLASAAANMWIRIRIKQLLNENCGRTCPCLGSRSHTPPVNRTAAVPQDVMHHF